MTELLIVPNVNNIYVEQCFRKFNGIQISSTSHQPSTNGNVSSFKTEEKIKSRRINQYEKISYQHHCFRE